MLEKKTVEFGIKEIEFIEKQRQMKEQLLQEQQRKKKIIIMDCPCCGAKACHSDSYGRNTISCTVCGLTTPASNTFEICLKIWNARI